MLRTKLFIIGYFAPSWIASLFLWGDDRTSAEFAAAPAWFFPIQILTQAVAISLLFLPPRVRPMPSLPILFVSILIIGSLYFADPIIEAENLLITGSILIAAIALPLAIFMPTARLSASDFGLLFYLFLGGFSLQIILYSQFGIMPSHSIEDVFVRFNGITNDSLTTAFILPVLIPWAATGRYSVLKLLVLNGEAFMTGSMFAMVSVPALTLAFLIVKRNIGQIAFVGAVLIAAAIYFYDTIARIFEIKFLSVLSHLRFFLDVSGASYYKSVSCSEEFCESFVESGSHLSVVYVLAFYALVFAFVLPLYRAPRLSIEGSRELSALRIFGSVLLIGSLVHPVPILPLVVPLFLIMASVYRATWWDATPGVHTATRAVSAGARTRVSEPWPGIHSNSNS